MTTDAGPKTLVAYGDSNTWGAATRPRPDGRYGPEERWPGVLQRILGHDWRVIEEGLNGRTTVHADPVEGEWLNGADYLLPCLKSHAPVDLVVIALGANDLKARFAVTAADIAFSLGRLVEIARSSGTGRNGGGPSVIVVAPPPIPDYRSGFPDWRLMFDGAPAKSRALGPLAAAVAQENGVGFIDAGRHITVSNADGLHLDPEAHATLGKVIADFVLSKG
jgi:lysophospholipase L1-like esterase